MIYKFHRLNFDDKAKFTDSPSKFLTLADNSP